MFLILLISHQTVYKSVLMKHHLPRVPIENESGLSYNLYFHPKSYWKRNGDIFERQENLWVVAEKNRGILLGLY